MCERSAARSGRIGNIMSLILIVALYPNGRDCGVCVVARARGAAGGASAGEPSGSELQSVYHQTES